ncbi:hypothetical protein [Pseudonocardia sp.]|uniref:hypothetical protein n=1 Tax=Pseudonocardia sp. TaxID=60912 RepID=UPI003D152FB5
MTHRPGCRIRTVLAFVVASATLAAAGELTSVAAAAVPAVPVATADALPAAALQLAGLEPMPQPRLGPAGSLTDEITGLSARLGVGLDAAAVGREVAAARLGTATESALATLLVQLRTCDAATAAMTAATPHEQLVAGLAEPRPADVAAVRDCAVALRAGLEALRPSFPASAGAGPLRVWPVLAYSPGDADDVYVEDYVLLVDEGGDDVYLNNQGANQIDVKRSVTGAAARYREPARGCRQTYPDSVSGRVVRGPDGSRTPSLDGPECVPSAALLWDRGGNDTYGRLQDPEFPDDLCSAAPSVARFSTIGAGVEGVGMLVDDAGDDRYTGRTGTMGAGHIGGVGLLEDRAGNDRYVAMRNAQGLGLLVGIGVLRDDGGDDVYDYYMPAPLDPAAEFHADGSGGVIDDSGLGSEIGASPNAEDRVGGRCDATPRSLQGVGIFVAPAVGLLVDAGGDDLYRAAGYRNQEEGFPTQSGTGLIRFAHGSQGSGYLGGIGVFLDLAGRDRYVRENHEPAEDRRDGMLAGPQPDLTFDEVGSPTNGRPLDLSVFYDAE